MMRLTVHFTSSVQTFQQCECGLHHVLRYAGLYVLPDPPDAPRFDYERQAWIVDGKYIRCAHPEAMNCTCYGKLHEGEEAVSET